MLVLEQAFALLGADRGWNETKMNGEPFDGQSYSLAMGSGFFHQE